MGVDGVDTKTKVLSIRDERGNEMESCPHPKQMLTVTVEGKVSEGTILKM